jgi:hypothetical protein
MGSRLGSGLLGRRRLLGKDYHPVLKRGVRGHVRQLVPIFGLAISTYRTHDCSLPVELSVRYVSEVPNHSRGISN